VPGLIERCRLLLAAGDWEGASGAAGALLAADGSNVLGLAVTGALLCKRGRQRQERALGSVMAAQGR
jgi:hypothetical protein